MNRIAALLIIVVAVAPSAAYTNPPRTADAAKKAVGAKVKRCTDKHDGEGPVELDNGRACELMAWSELGRHYPSIADRLVARERAFNQQVGRTNEARKQRQKAQNRNEELAYRLGEKGAENERLRTTTLPKFVTYTVAVAALLVGGGAGYWIGRATSDQGTK